VDTSGPGVVDDPASWKPDPLGRHELRWWNGTAWTDDIANSGVVSKEGQRTPPLVAPAASATSSGMTLFGRPLDSNGIAMLLGASALLLGSLLPWAQVNAGLFSRSVNGTDGDGIITLGLAAGIVALLFTMVLKPGSSRGGLICVLVCGLIALAVTGYDAANITRLADESFVEVEVGIGLYACLGGAIAASIGAFLALRQSSKAL
jgi:hypothetical protein